MDDLVDIFVKQARSILEFGAPVWNLSITRKEVTDMERVQNSFLHIVLEKDYVDYESALDVTNL